jgi:hypothetical protein
MSGVDEYRCEQAAHCWLVTSEGKQDAVQLLCGALGPRDIQLYMSNEC